MLQNISDYYQWWKHLCCLIFLWNYDNYLLYLYLNINLYLFILIGGSKEIVCNITFTVTFDQFNLSLLNKSINLFPKIKTDLLNGRLPCFAFLPLNRVCTFPHRPRRCWPSHCPAGKISVPMAPGCPTQWYPWLRVCRLQCQSYQSPRLRWSTATGLVSHIGECTTINIWVCVNATFLVWETHTILLFK